MGARKDQDQRITLEHELFVKALQNLAAVTDLAKSLAMQNPHSAEQLLHLTVLATNQTSRRLQTGMGPLFGQRESPFKESK